QLRFTVQKLHGHRILVVSTRQFGLCPIHARDRNHHCDKNAHDHDHLSRQHATFPALRADWNNHHKTPSSIMPVSMANTLKTMHPIMMPLTTTSAVVSVCAAPCSCWKAFASNDSNQPFSEAKKPDSPWVALSILQRSSRLSSSASSASGSLAPAESCATARTARPANTEFAVLSAASVMARGSATPASSKRASIEVKSRFMRLRRHGRFHMIRSTKWPRGAMPSDA